MDRKLGPFVMEMIFKYACGSMKLKNYEDLSNRFYINGPDKIEQTKNEERKIIRHGILKLRLLCKDYAYGVYKDFILNSIHVCIENEIPSHDSPQFWRDNFNKVGLLVINVNCKFLNIYYPANNIVLIGHSEKIYVSKDVNYIRIEEGPCNLDNVHAKNIKFIGQRSGYFGSKISPSIKSLKFKDCDCVVFSEIFADLHSLSITDCINFYDNNQIKSLKNHTLKLKSLNGITDVSCLGHIKNLIIDNLPITSLNGLEHIPVLELRNIKNVDISRLQNKKLILHNVRSGSGESANEKRYRYDKTEYGPIIKTEYEERVERFNTVTIYGMAVNYVRMSTFSEEFNRCYTYN